MSAECFGKGKASKVDEHQRQGRTSGVGRSRRKDAPSSPPKTCGVSELQEEQAAARGPPQMRVQPRIGNTHGCDWSEVLPGAVQCGFTGIAVK